MTKIRLIENIVSNSALKLSQMHWNPVQSFLKGTYTVSHFSRSTDSSLLVGPYAWANHKNSISFSLRKWGGCSESDTHYQLSSETRNYPSYSYCHLLASCWLSNDSDSSQIRSLHCCSSTKSHVSLPENGDGAVRRRTLSSLERGCVPPCCHGSNLQALGAGIDNFPLNAKAQG